MARDAIDTGSGKRREDRSKKMVEIGKPLAVERRARVTKAGGKKVGGRGGVKPARGR